jgi:hypothetical protein
MLVALIMVTKAPVKDANNSRSEFIPRSSTRFVNGSCTIRLAATYNMNTKPAKLQQIRERRFNESEAATAISICLSLLLFSYLNMIG